MASSIYIASGHGGTDPGATGNGLAERDLNAAICRLLVARLREHGLRAHTDLEVGNPGRAGAIADARKRGDVVLYYAQHHNGFGRASARGYEIYKTGSGRSLRFARAVHRAQLAALRAVDARIPDRGVKEARGTRAEGEVVYSPGSSVLAENLFVTNPDDARIARRPDYAARLAEATCRAIVEFGRAEGLWRTAYKPPAPDPVAVVRDASDRVVARPTTWAALGEGAVKAYRGTGKAVVTRR